MAPWPIGAQNYDFVRTSYFSARVPARWTDPALPQPPPPRLPRRPLSDLFHNPSPSSRAQHTPARTIPKPAAMAGLSEAARQLVCKLLEIGAFKFGEFTLKVRRTVAIRPAPVA